MKRNGACVVVSILILLDTGWKQYEHDEDDASQRFNPHLTGYGLEGDITNIPQIAQEVSILILLDTGWK